MSIEISEVKSLPLYQIMGAPVLALVQAEAQAAQATAEFIERVGFVVSEDDGLDDARDVDHIGQLRMFTFHYQKPGATGGMQDFQVQIPLLSLIPIPSVQVKEAEIEFDVHIHDMYSQDLGSIAHARDSDEGDFLAPQRVGLRAGFDKRGSEYPMKVKMKIEEAHVPSGMLALFKVMDQSINSILIPPKPTPEPIDPPSS